MIATGSNQPRLAVTPGEPAGIGPDICVRLAQLELPCQLIFFADPKLLADRAMQLGLNLDINLYHPENICSQQAGSLTVVPIPLSTDVYCGKVDLSNSSYVLECIRSATQACMDGFCDAMVTGPVHKAVINDAGFNFSGHTEFIAEITGGTPLMVLATPGLRVALATTHLPLSKVSSAINQDLLENLLNLLHRELGRRFAICSPRILVCGLNPHAGENGHLGREELEIIIPVIERLKKQGLDIAGPLPADTLFTQKYLENADVVLAMYHDQGLPVLKYMGFGQAVNITLGLPIIRTSVDHGTALDIAGTGQADFGSLKFAVQTALDMIRFSV
jgi:4-hydroxythreonine-4-phosphate dehydrogenase